MDMFSLSYKFLERIESLVTNNCDSEPNPFMEQEKDRGVLFPYIPENNY